MVGFGPEDDHFVAELTYNYGVGEYKLGNDFRVRKVQLHFLQRSECLLTISSFHTRESLCSPATL